MSVRIEMTGVKELVAELDKLDRKMRRKGIRRAVTAAARPLRAAYRARVPVKHGALRKAIDVKVKSYRGGSRIIAIVGARSDYEITVTDRFGNARRIVPNKYAHLIEFGSKAHTARLGRITFEHPGTRGTGALRGAVYQAGPEIERIMIEKLRETLCDAGS